MPPKPAFILILFLFNSCWLAGPRYKSIDTSPHPIKVTLYATTKKDTTRFNVFLYLDRPHQLNLSNIKVELRTYPGNQEISSTPPDSVKGVYPFINISPPHHYHRLKVLLTANARDGEHSDTLRQQMLFKKYFYVDIAGN